MICHCDMWSESLADISVLLLEIWQDFLALGIVPAKKNVSRSTFLVTSFHFTDRSIALRLVQRCSYAGSFHSCFWAHSICHHISTAPGGKHPCSNSPATSQCSHPISHQHPMAAICRENKIDTYKKKILGKNTEENAVHQYMHRSIGSV